MSHNSPPSFGDNWVKVICRKYVSFWELWLVKDVLRPLLFLGPPVLVTTIITRAGLLKQLEQPFLDGPYAQLTKDIGGFLRDSGVFILLAAFLYIVLSKALFSLIRNYSRPAKELQTSDIISILTAIDIVVRDKCTRMNKSAKTALNRNKGPSAGEVFLDITRPDQQIGLLTTSIKSVFDYIDNSGAEFKVRLISVVESKPKDWFAVIPIEKAPRTSINELCSPSSTVSRCIERRDMVIIEDINSELTKNSKKERDFVKGKTSVGEAGSLICFPIIHSATQNVEYVICLSANKSYTFRKTHSPLYDLILKEFKLRIELEHSLLILRGTVS